MLQNVCCVAAEDIKHGGVVTVQDFYDAAWKGTLVVFFSNLYFMLDILTCSNSLPCCSVILSYYYYYFFLIPSVVKIPRVKNKVKNSVWSSPLTSSSSSTNEPRNATAL